MHNPHSYVVQKNKERLDEAAEIDITDLRSFSPTERNEKQRRRTSLISSRDVKETHQTPRKHSMDASGKALSINTGEARTEGRLHLSIPSPSGAESSQPKKYLSDFPLVQKLLNNQLKNNDFAFLEKLLLWNSDKDLRFCEREDPSSVTMLRSIRNMLMKDLVRTRFGLKGDVQNQDGSMRVSMTRTATESLTEDGPAAQKLEVSTLERFRAITWDFMENPNSSRAAYVVSVSILLLILLSSITFCMETVESLKDSRPAFYIIEVVAIVCFTVEYLIRLFSCPELLPFLRAPLNVIDIIAILPFYIEQLGKGTSFHQLVRAVGAQTVSSAVISSGFQYLIIFVFFVCFLLRYRDRPRARADAGAPRRSPCTRVPRSEARQQVGPPRGHHDGRLGLDRHAHHAQLPAAALDGRLLVVDLLCREEHLQRVERSAQLQVHPGRILVVYGDADDCRIWRCSARDARRAIDCDEHDALVHHHPRVANLSHRHELHIAVDHLQRPIQNER